VWSDPYAVDARHEALNLDNAMAQSPILIIGAGAIGSVIGAHLCARGEDVAMIDVAAPHVEAIKQNGLRLTGTNPLHVRPRAFHPDELAQRFERVILAVKARDTAGAMPSVERHLADDGWVLPLQNGLGMLDIASRVGERRIVGAVIAIGAFYEEPGVINFAGRGDTHIGEIDGRASVRVDRLVAMLSCVQPTYASSNIIGDAWGKLALCAAYAGTALSDSDVLSLYEQPSARAILTRLVREVALAARANGVVITPADGIDPASFVDADDPEEAGRWRGQVAAWRNYTTARTGIWRDLAIRRRPTEVAAQLNPVLDIARSHKVATPGLACLLELIANVEAGIYPLSMETFLQLARA
jgi:2-dehydropantoate 2-reductase